MLACNLMRYPAIMHVMTDYFIIHSLIWVFRRGLSDAEVDRRFGFIIPCYILPDDTQEFHRRAAAAAAAAARESGAKGAGAGAGAGAGGAGVGSAAAWMVKPLARGEGHGLFVATSVAEVENTTNE